MKVMKARNVRTVMRRGGGKDAVRSNLHTYITPITIITSAFFRYLPIRRCIQQLR